MSRKALITINTKILASLLTSNSETNTQYVMTDSSFDIIDVNPTYFNNIIEKTFNISYEKICYKKLVEETEKLMRIVNKKSDDLYYELCVEYGDYIKILKIKFFEIN